MDNSSSKRSRFKENIFVSSEDDKILNYAYKLGVNIIKRPIELSQDDSSSESAIKHALRNININIKYVIFLQVTSPLRKVDDIDKAFNILRKK